MLGGICFFTGIDFRWKAAAADARIPLDAMHVAPNLAEAITAARQLREQTASRGKAKWQTLLDRLRR